MNIRMYNCYFGDCFKIVNDSGNDLLVDFGIQRTCTSTSNQINRFDDIYNDICNDSLDFLLSHYHEDHYNGVEYVVNKVKKVGNYSFSDVYIPDIWSFKGNIPAVSLHLLRMILDKSYLSGGTTLFSFLKAICNSSGKIHFIQRGMPIQNKYIALWPSESFIKKKSKSLLDRIRNDENADYIDRLNEISGQLIQVVQAMSSSENRSYFISQIDRAEENFINTNWDYNFDNASRVNVILGDFGNNISIVFQNKESNIFENLLFTGDFGKPSALWNAIETNADSTTGCDMHSTYHAIKVGHHGTRGYYHSFVRRMNSDSILLIPNGGYRKNWGICSDYSLNAITTKAKVVCSTDSNCEAKNCCGGSCPCVNRIVIGANIYYDIT